MCFKRQQNAVMIDCYNKGKDLSKCYPRAMCQKEMKSHAEIGPQNILTTQVLNQTKQYDPKCSDPKQIIMTLKF